MSSSFRVRSKRGLGTGSGDSTPDAFTFTDLTGQPLSTEVASAPITVQGINAAAIVTISGGTYSKNGGEFTAAQGLAVSGDTFSVKVTTSDTADTGVNAILTIGGVSDTFTATTGNPDSTPDAFTFTDITDATLSTLYTSNQITITGIDTTVAVSIVGGTYSKNGGGYVSTAGSAVANDTFTVRVTSSGTNSQGVSATLTVGTVSDTYTVTTAASGGATTHNNIFGALSASLDTSGQPAAYVTTTGTSISSGNGSGHFEVAGGKLYVSAAGDTANLNAGPYTLTMNDGSVHNITVQADTYSVSTQEEWNRVIKLNGALSGKTIRVRRLPNDGVYTSNTGTLNSLRRINYGDGTPLTIQGDDLSNIPSSEDHSSPSSLPLFSRMPIIGVRNLIIEYLDNPETSHAYPNAHFDLTSSTTWPNDNITIRNCRIRGVTLDPYADLSGGLGPLANEFPTGIGIRSIGTAHGDYTFNDNHITWCEQGINTYCGTSLETSGNRVAYCYTDGVQGNYSTNCGAWNCKDNVISHPMGRSEEGVHWDGIRALASPTGTTDWEVHIERNIIYHGDCRGSIQDILLTDFPSTVYFTGTIIGNITAADSTHALSVSTCKNMTILNNTCLAQLDGTDYEDQACHLKISNVGFGGNVRCENNLAEFVTEINASVTQSGNVGIGKTKAAYLTRVAGPNFNPQTRADVLAQYETISGTAGALGTGAVTFATVCPGHDGVTNVS